ncbi:cytidine/deoxycytidylate deaminase family protein [Metarhizium robertsii ARSEF 23]|uniref:Cytidine/deoxycytidylate deaminase family protein n=1 Tax=Metarhizium robertsii (strain ARSEF 23 / ATCC MYA-3075) TaxID=655844 RepID=A0A0B2X7C6_METRA|nr:cytidine/deoxycytidylate deaminase family protein [Metarhizium robertsii ARSEF 23]KHO10823.1 cytidine/deoxycytidylate deaminase family protein [Metarhizium robertsii ARSEF 23]
MEEDGVTMRGKPSRSGWAGSMLVQEYLVAADSDLGRLMESQTGRLMGSRWRSPQVARAAAAILKIYNVMHQDWAYYC